MLIVDDILLLPVSGLKWVFRQIATAAEREMTDDSAVKDELLELQMALETGEVGEEEYRLREAELMKRLRDIRALRDQLGQEPPEESDAFISYH
ncbi:MAG: gas vesicle protein GvpG [Chloroflexota bacterium]|nr:gas vesicle protein GvpG [Chloroflexota bacterium]